MAIQSYGLVMGSERCSGAVLVDTVSGHPLPISTSSFEDIEDADDFFDFAHAVVVDDGRRDLRFLDETELEALVKDWRASKARAMAGQSQ